MAITASRQGADPGGRFALAIARAASSAAAARSASSAATWSKDASPVRSRAASGSSRRRYATRSAATGPGPGWRAGLAGAGLAGPGPARDRLGVRRARTDRGQQLGPHLGRLRCGKVIAAGQDLPVRRVPGQVIPERRACPEHGRQPGTQPGVLAKRPGQFPVAGHPCQRGQRQIGVRGSGQRVEQPVSRMAGIHCEIPGEQEFRPARVGEAQPGQPCGGGGPARHAHPSTVTVRGAPPDAGQQNARSASRWSNAGKRVHSFRATSGPVMRASSGKVAAMMPRATRIPPTVSR